MAGPHSRLRRLSCDACWRRSGEFLQQLLGFTRFTQLEVTGISWGLQFEIDGVSQSLWGHHRSRDSGEAMAQKYGKDDVLPALCGQLKVVQAIRRGWCLLTPQARRARRPFTEGRLLPKPSPLVSARWVSTRRTTKVRIQIQNLGLRAHGHLRATPGR